MSLGLIYQLKFEIPELNLKTSSIELKKPNLENSNIRGTVGMFLKMM